MLDYYEIGQRIRKTRKARRLSQEQLAELVGISVTHMSHIETANTKLSLPVLAAIASALDVQIDTLVYEQPRDSVTVALKDVSDVLETCSAKEARLIADVVRGLKQSIDIYF